jgi:glucosamine--fructose-6-phosphate aminotransferase (isomerizing)
MKKLSAQVKEVLTMKIPEDVSDRLVAAGTIYFAGRNNGVTEEITLKTNEIMREKSDFLEGTYALHGIEEVMDKTDAMVVINPFKEEEDKFDDVIQKGVGYKLWAVATRDTSFQTIKIPDAGDFTTYLELAAGWNILIDAGIKLGINLDKTIRARKIGNAI